MEKISTFCDQIELKKKEYFYLKQTVSSKLRRLTRDQSIFLFLKAVASLWKYSAYVSRQKKVELLRLPQLCK